MWTGCGLGMKEVDMRKLIFTSSILAIVFIAFFSAPFIGQAFALEKKVKNKRKKKAVKKIVKKYEEVAVEKGIFGWIEKVKIKPGNILLHAKLDSGADHSSLSAMNISEFKKKGKNWVRFDLRSRTGEIHTIELKTHRKARIKRIEGNTQSRPVVRMGLCLGDKFLNVDVNLADRSNFAFPLLIGRNFLAPNVLLDTSKTYTADPSCKEKFGKKK